MGANYLARAVAIGQDYYLALFRKLTDERKSFVVLEDPEAVGLYNSGIGYRFNFYLVVFALHDYGKVYL